MRLRRADPGQELVLVIDLRPRLTRRPISEARRKVDDAGRLERVRFTAADDGGGHRGASSLLIDTDACAGWPRERLVVVYDASRHLVWLAALARLLQSAAQFASALVPLRL
ncbi:Uncharacterised protein [Mycobacteroides abscessus subsp. abscessus]|nr:Uncharacterised protein [Mycobacteroides abscessus subsp. abscessus]